MNVFGLRAVCSIAFLVVVVPAGAQVIPIKTIPIAQGDQFQIYPSNNLGLGGVSIALADSLGDPFANPATTARLRGSWIFSAPTVYSVSRRAGGGRSLPLAMLARQATWYGGLAVVLLQVDPRRPPDQGGLAVAWVLVAPAAGSPAPIPLLDMRATRPQFETQHT